MIKLKFNIQESGKAKKFNGVYYKWGHDAKGTSSKMTMEKDLKKLADGYEKCSGSDFKGQKRPGATGMT